MDENIDNLGSSILADICWGDQSEKVNEELLKSVAIETKASSMDLSIMDHWDQVTARNSGKINKNGKNVNKPTAL